MKQIFLGIVLAIATLSLSAQSSNKYTGTLLWKVSGKDLKQPSYILGSHHLAPLNTLDNINGFKHAAANTTQVAGEILMSDKAAIQNKIMQRAMLPVGTTYKTLLSNADYNKLDTNLKSVLGVGLDQLGVMHPAMINMTYAITIFTKSYPDVNLVTHIAIDEQVQNDAIKNGKSVIGLETADDQLKALFDMEPIKDQAESLVCSTEDTEYNIKLIKQLTDFYKKGQLDKMYDLSFNNPNDKCKSSEAFQNGILRNRNNNWLKKLPSIMKDKPTLVVVGALHLAGEEGLLYQLDKMGYTIEAVK